MPRMHHCYIMSPEVNEPYKHIGRSSHERLRVISSEVGNQAMV